MYFNQWGMLEDCVVQNVIENHRNRTTPTILENELPSVSLHERMQKQANKECSGSMVFLKS
jgi:hypothetical protein